MATINDYTIYCTEEQTKKALALGAPIIKASSLDALMNKPYFIHDNAFVVIPTAEQMIGWLENRTEITGIFIEGMEGVWGYRIYRVTSTDCLEPDWSCQYGDRKKATLAAIDAALDYLTK